MRIRTIEKVVLYQLKGSSDRRGKIADFYIQKVPNMEYIRLHVLRFLWSLTTMLADCYHQPEMESLYDPRHYIAEHNECWIFDTDYKDGLILMKHKYWSDAQLQCFYSMIQSLAVLHGWELEDRR